jgi:hypothetical protein
MIGSEFKMLRMGEISESEVNNDRETKNIGGATKMSLAGWNCGEKEYESVCHRAVRLSSGEKNRWMV